jgi:hypothetical protein
MRSTRATISIAVFLGLALVTPSTPVSAAPIVWTGPSIDFTKPDFADWTLAANQDRLTDSVWLTRADTMPLFNILLESEATFGSPADTEWAFGPTQPGDPGPITASNFASLTFSDFVTALSGRVGRNVLTYGPGVLHLISEDIYLDITFTAWSEVSGGGFSYTRSTPGPRDIPEPAAVTLLAIGAAARAGFGRWRKRR